jgi:hypothetical protein
LSQSPIIDHRIKSLIFVLGSAFACASLLVALLIHQWGPSGRYIAGQTLLSPQTIEEINQRSQEDVAKKKKSFIFDHIEFSYFDENQRTMRQQPVSIENYEKFYQMISSEKSLDQSETLNSLFTGMHPTILTITMHATEKNASAQSAQIFQMIQFKDNYFRVQLHEGEEKGEWAYFYYSNLYTKIFQLFIAL